MLALSTKNEILGAFTVHIGTVNQSFACTKDILQRAILSNASCIIVAHNHPSGNPEPSPEDRSVTRKIKDACELLDIQLLDHLIIGADGKRFSFAEKGLI
jgi:DNA repair protein RadC